MKVHELKRELWVPGSPDEIFKFFDRPENLSRLTPTTLGFKILTPGPIRMERGRLIDYTVNVLGIPQRWTTLITEYDPPHSFVDEQVKGPYSFWHHTHTFTPKDGGTLITDHIRYALPFLFLGNIAHWLFVKRQLEGIFGFRETVVRELFGK